MLTFPSEPPTTCGTPAANYWSSLGELRKLTSFVQAQNSTNCFFSNPRNPQRFRAWRHLRPLSISYLGLLLWHVWLSHPPRTHLNTCAQCVHLTNPCIKRKVLSLIKPKGKIYKTKCLPPQLYYTIPNTQKIAFNASLPNTQHYKVQIKGKVDQSWERSSALPYTLE